jgi:hypothetical protein
MTKPEILEYIKQQYDLLNDQTLKNDRYQIYYNLIQVKLQFNVENHIIPIYVDVKRLIILYFEETELKDFGYDEFRFISFQNLLEKFSPEKRIPLIAFLIRKCKENDIDVSQMSKYYIGSRKQYLYKEHKYVRYLLVTLANNFWTLLFCYIVYLVILALIISPVPDWGIPMYDVKLIDISSNNLLNYLCNAIALLFAPEEYAPTVLPTGVISLILFVFGKLISYLIIGNYLYQKLFDYLKISDDGNN